MAAAPVGSTQGTPVSPGSPIISTYLPDVWHALLIEGWAILGSFYFVFKSTCDLPASGDSCSGWCSTLSYQKQRCRWLQRRDPLGSNEGGWNKRQESLTEEFACYFWFVFSQVKHPRVLQQFPRLGRQSQQVERALHIAEDADFNWSFKNNNKYVEGWQ